MTKATSSPCFISPHLVMTCHPALCRFLLRPRRLTRVYTFPWAGLSRRLLAPIDRACSTLEEVRLRAGSWPETSPKIQGSGHIWLISNG
jgi:hypothetical protein